MNSALRILPALLLSTSAFGADILQADLAQGITVILTDEVGPCANPARVARWIEADPKNFTLGCYKLVPGNYIQIAWLDADTGTIPAPVFKPVKGS